MMKHIKHHIINTLIAGCIFLIPGCEPDRCFHGTGTESSIIVETGYFQEMNVYGLLHIILVEDTIHYVEFEGGEKLLEYAEASNTDSVLKLDYTTSCFFLRKYEKVKAYVHYKNLNKVNVFEVCLLESYDSLSAFTSLTVQGEMAEVNLILNGERFGFYNNRTTGGKYTFSGNVDRCWIRGYYTANFEMKDFTARDYYVLNSSLSDMYVNATERLTVQILHDGNVYYSGAPEIVVDSVSGNGRLLPWEE